GGPGTVSLSAGVSPAGPTASLSPASVAAGGGSTLTIGAGGAVAPGSYTVTVTGTEGSFTPRTTVALTVNATPQDFSMSANPTSVTVAQAGNGTSAISTGAVGCGGTI